MMLFTVPYSGTHFVKAWLEDHNFQIDHRHTSNRGITFPGDYILTMRNPVLSLISWANRGQPSISILRYIINRMKLSGPCVQVDSNNRDHLWEVHRALGLKDESITQRYIDDWPVHNSLRGDKREMCPHLYDDFNNKNKFRIERVFREEFRIMRAVGVPDYMKQWGYEPWQF